LISIEPDIVDQFNEGIPELRDLNSYVDILCSSDIKTRHLYAFIVEILIILLFFLYGLILKRKLRDIKLNYFLYHRKHIDEFDDMVIKETDCNRDVLKEELDKGFTQYVVRKVFGSIILFIAAVSLLALKYSFPEARNLFLPFENECGPTLVST